MVKHAIVIASGETDRRAVPHLLSHLRTDDIEVTINIPPRNKKLTVHMAEGLIKSALFDGTSPDKFVVLVDLDGKEPDEELRSFREDLPGNLRDRMAGRIQYAYAQWHLESWFSGDAEHPREYLDGKALGNVDTAHPDEIQNPKILLKHLLERSYTALVSEEIAIRLDPHTIAQRSRSFGLFLEAVRNGASSQP